MRNLKAEPSRRSVLAGVGAAIAAGIVATPPASAEANTSTGVLGTALIPDPSVTYAARANNLSDLADASAARSNIDANRAQGLDVRDAFDLSSAVTSSAFQRYLSALAPNTRVVIPRGSVVNLDGLITVDKAGVSFTGGGELRFNSGITTTAAVKIIAADVLLDDITISNPNALSAATGGKNIGVDIRAHNVTVNGCSIFQFQNGIQVGADGEWMGARLTNNRIIDVIGAGSGPTRDDGNGEDRGDGITCWGARAIITGNIVNAKAGTDARVGIHAEALPSYEAVVNSNSDAMVVISNNVVSGQFRRGITAEDMSNTVISGNTIADSTWWAIDIVGGTTSPNRGSSVTGNTIRWTRSGTDNQGSNWAPRRAPIMLYRNVIAATVTGNTIHIIGTAEQALIGQSVSGVGITDCAITCNTVWLDSAGTCSKGFVFADGTACIVSNNRIKMTAGASSDPGISTTGCNGFVISGNRITGADAGMGIYHSGSAGTSITDNIIDRVDTGISLINSTSGGTITNNSMTNCPLGVDLFGSTGRCIIRNRFGSGVTTQYKNTSYSGNQSFCQTKHAMSITPTGGQTGDIFVGTGKIWVNDAGIWKSVTIS